MPALHALLLDFDGLLADYDHRRFLQQLAEAVASTPAQLDTALRSESLELAHARGELNGEQLLQALNDRLDCNLQASDWHRARAAATVPRRDCVALLDRVHREVSVAILTNNGALTLPVIQQMLPNQTVLGSAVLGIRKPDPDAYRAACTALGCEPARALFVDHLFRNVQGARAAGLHADTAYHAQSLRRLLRRFHLLA
ncbi:HAD-IA family hydrolase [Stenotrophomonas sp. Iso1]|uniref:HAD-IA family hydrolase n=1 Tax=Stenotrophomonas sp. Iso1 TaxID=2977283 RepID=UPI0022B79342|nr:HAD-IA family hydrolase [Stenotrophomonas sp. Iso1]